MRLFLLAIFINILVVEGRVDLENLADLNPDGSSSTFSPVEGNPRSKGSSGLFFLHLLKHKLNKLQMLNIHPTTSSHSDCICVPYSQCDANNNIILNSLGTFDIRVRPCTGDLEVCCHLRISITSTTTTSRPTTTTPKPTTTTPNTTTTTTPKPTTTTTPKPTTTTTTTTPKPTTTRIVTTTIPMPVAITACFCVNVWQCDVNGFIIADGSGLINPRQVHYGVCNQANQVCCKLNPYMIQPTAPPPSTSLIFNTVPPAKNCYCVNSWQCDANGFIIIGGSGLINIQQAYAGLCTQTNQVCCRLNSNIQTTTAVVTQFPIVTPIPIQPRPLTSTTTTSSSNIPITTITPTFLPGETCMCVLVTECSQNGGHMRIDQTGNINTRYVIGSLRQVGSSCSNILYTCCRIIFSENNNLALPANLHLRNPTNIKKSGTRNNNNTCVWMKSQDCLEENVIYPSEVEFGDFYGSNRENEVCCRIQNNNRYSAGTSMTTGVSSLSLSSDDNCGFISKAFAPALIESGKTYFAEFPWMVALFLRYSGRNDEFFCGASMINSQAILTAAHCVDNKDINAMVARFGEWDRNTKSEPLPFQEAKIEAIVIHPLYYNAALFYDLAVVILKTSVNETLNVQPICLPNQEQSFPPGTRCYATGWGNSAFGTEGQYQNLLRKIDLPLIDHKDCQSRLRQTKLGPNFHLHSSFLCAGGEQSRDTCRGDGGGPLICPIPSGQYVQIGIISWGIGCGSENPAVYANVAQQKSWINQQLINYRIL